MLITLLHFICICNCVLLNYTFSNDSRGHPTTPPPPFQTLADDATTSHPIKLCYVTKLELAAGPNSLQT
jgi:hypothetical protein